jgi:hypothetical protein
VQVPFILTRHIQEDAYITFRCALNLADSGVYGSNPGERVSASTSHLSVFAIACLRWLSGDAFIPVTQVLYGVATVGGIYLLSDTLAADRRQKIRIWIVASLLPVSLMIAYGGMETGFLILLMGAILRTTTLTTFSWWSAVAFILLPWVRPDAIAIGLLALIVGASIGRTSWRATTMYGVLLLVGTILWILFNRLYFGTFLPQTILGKGQVWLPSGGGDAIRSGVSKLQQLWFGTGAEPGMFVPIHTRYLRRFAVPGLVLSLGVISWLCARPVRFRAEPAPVVTLALVAFGLPPVYALSGVVNPWHLWPSQLAVALLVVVAYFGWLDRQTVSMKRTTASLGFAVLGILVVAQWCFAVSWGTQERLYRGGIGERISSVSAHGDTLLLEPAGYIPFYARLFTWDEIGVASPQVTQYRVAYGSHWWMQFIRDVAPTFLLERDHIRANLTRDGYLLSPEEQAWFKRHYRIVQVFTYNPSMLRSSRALKYIAGLGSAGEYVLYQNIPDVIE